MTKTYSIPKGFGDLGKSNLLDDYRKFRKIQIISLVLEIQLKYDKDEIKEIIRQLEDR